METVREGAGKLAGDRLSTMTTFEAIAAQLAASGVTQVFGLMGDDTVRLVSALVARGVAYHNLRHENAAVAMAAGHAAATGELSVCVISRGPGTTNAITAAVNADRGGSAVIVITGEERVGSARNSVAVPDSKFLDAALVMRGAALRTFSPERPETVAETLVDAERHARRGHTVFFAIPQDVFQAEVTRSDAPPDAADLTVVPAPPRPARAEAVAAARAVIDRSRRPVIVAGHGAWVSGARDGLVELADRLGAVLCTTLRGKDMFRGHPYDCGLLGSFSHSAGRRLIEGADLVLAFGAGLNRYTTTDGTSLPSAPVVQVDALRENIGRYHWAEVGVVGDARLVVEQLLDGLPQRSSSEMEARSAGTESALAQFDHRDDFEPAASRWAMDPRELLCELDRLLPTDRAVITDNGNFFGFVPTYVSVPSPDRFKLSSDFAVIGLGFGTALGTAVARPGVTSVLFIGDGGLLMSLGELESLARLQTPLIVVVMNDRGYGAEKHFLEQRGFSGTTAMFPDVEFAAVAESFGIESATVQTLDDLRTLAPELSGRTTPYLLDCKVTADVVAPFLSGSHL